MAMKQPAGITRADEEEDEEDEDLQKAAHVYSAAQQSHRQPSDETRNELPGT